MIKVTSGDSKQIPNYLSTNYCRQLALSTHTDIRGHCGMPVLHLPALGFIYVIYSLCDTGYMTDV